jgi:hypothetical protein
MSYHMERKRHHQSAASDRSLKPRLSFALDGITRHELENEARKIYETRVVADSLARLAKLFDLKSLPFSDEELQTLATRARESFRSEKKRERLARYKVHLVALYGEERVASISAALQDINNAIGYEEK